MIVDIDTLFGFWPRRQVDISLERLQTLMARHQIETACVCSARGVCYDFVEGNRETIAASRANPGLVPVATLDPRRFLGCRDEIDRCRDQGVRLFRLFPGYQGWELSSPAGRRLLEMLENAGAMVMVDGAPAALLPALRGLTVPVILTGAHFYYLADVLAELEALPNLYLTSRFFIGPGSIDVWLAAAGPERLLFGSHAPLAYPAAALNLVKGAGLSPEARAAVLGENTRRLLEGAE